MRKGRRDGSWKNKGMRAGVYRVRESDSNLYDRTPRENGELDF